MPAPKLKPGEKDGRVRAGRKPKKPGEAKSADLKIRLKPDDKEWLKAQPDGANQWIEDRIREARQAESSV